VLDFLRTGPARHLRRINLYFSHSFDPAFCFNFGERPRFSVDPVMVTLAETAVGIEHLKLTIWPERSYTVRGLRGMLEFGPTIRIREYSWMDPPIGIRPTPNESENEDFQKSLTGEFTDLVTSKLMVSEDGLKDRAIIGMLLSRDNAGNAEQIHYLSGVWRRLWIIEDHKVFFGREMPKALGRLQTHRLKSISLEGAVDRMWIAAVAGLTGVPVRAKSWGAGWIAVEPNGSAV